MYSTNATLDLSYTYAMDKISCIKEMWTVHFILSWGIGIVGLLCIITRAHPKLKFMHVYLGRAYILLMLWNTAVSLLVHNVGLPWSVVWSFIWCLGGLTIGWIIIGIHQNIMTDKAMKNAQNQIQESPRIDNVLHEKNSLKDVINKEKQTIADGKSWGQRIFSWKALHGCLMVASWYQIAGRLPSGSSKIGDFECYTYPAYKPVEGSTKFNWKSGSPIQFLPMYDPTYYRLPWANNEVFFAVLGLFTPIILSLLIGAIVAFFAVRKFKNLNAIPK